MKRSPDRLRRLERIAHLMDEWIEIPVVGYRIGLDGVLGLIPGVGDLAGLFISLFFVSEAAKEGVSKWTLIRMGGNILGDALIGAIPVLGDVLDFFWKSNRSNLELFRKSQLQPQETRNRSALFVITIVFVIASLAIGLVWGIWSLIAKLVQMGTSF